MATNIVQKCKNLVEGGELNFMASFLGCKITEGYLSECRTLIEAFAAVYPGRFAVAVGEYLINESEVD